MRIIFTILLLFVFGTESVRAVGPPVRKLTTRQGLTQSDVKAIMQDRRGFIWISTNGGLNRYDGMTLKAIYPEVDSRPISQVFEQICEDPSGQFWIGIAGDFLLYDPATGQMGLFSQKYPSVPMQNYLPPSVAFDSGGRVWVTDSRALWNLPLSPSDPGPSVSLRLPAEGMHITSLLYDGRLWVGSDKGLYRYEAGRFVQVSPFSVTTLASAPQGLIAATAEGVLLLRQGSVRKLMPVAANSLTAASGKIWAGNSEGLYSCVPGADPVMEKVDLGEKLSVRSLGCDRNGQVWIGVDNGGVRILNPAGKRFEHYTWNHARFNNRIRSIHEDPAGNLWIGARDGGLAFFLAGDKGCDSPYFLSLEDEKQNAYSICSAGGDIYVVSDNLIRITLGPGPRFSQKLIPIAGSRGAMVCVADPKGDAVWVGTFYEGIFRYDIPSGRLSHIPVSLTGEVGQPAFVRNLKFDSENNLWIGTSEGLGVITAENLEKENYTPVILRNDPARAGSLSHNYVVPIFFDSHNTVYAGTFGGGLNSSPLDKRGLPSDFIRYTTANGMANNTIKSIEEDSRGLLWVSSGGGLTRLDPFTNEIINYSVDDGLQDNEFGELASCRRRNGEMLFGGVSGLNVFTPEQITVDTVPPQVALTDFHLMNRAVQVGEKIDGRVLLPQAVTSAPQIALRHNENSFTIHFAALHYLNPDRNHCAYILEGFDSEWNQTGAAGSQARYTNIPPGDYQFRVRAANPDGVWSDTEAGIRIVVKKAWWQTPLALALYLVVFIAAIAGIIRLTLYTQHNKLMLTVAELEKDKLRELSQMQVRFFTNISHEFRTPLSLIIAPVNQLLSPGKRQDEKTSRLLSTIRHNADILLRLINQLLDFSKYEQGKLEVHYAWDNVVSFGLETLSRFEEFASQRGVKLEFDCQEDSIELRADFSMLEHILYNLLTNGIKHTPPHGTVTLGIERESRRVLISVRDQGQGIPADMHERIFERFVQIRSEHATGGTGLGLSYTRSLVELGGGTISLESEPGHGATFYVRLPLDAHGEEDSKEISDHNGQYSDSDGDRSDDGEKQSTGGPGAPVYGNSQKLMLIVEDNPQVAEYLGEFFDGAYRVMTAPDGRQGWEMALKYAPEVIITDVMMPVMDGYQLCSKLKSDARTSHIPVVMLTAKATGSDLTHGYLSGADIYCPKPFDAEVLNAMVESLLSNRERLRKLYRSSLDVSPGELTTTAVDEKFLRMCMETVEKHLPDENFTVVALASKLGKTQYLLNKKLRSLIGMSANEFIRDQKLRHAAKMLTESDKTVSEITYEVGFNSLKYFRSCFIQTFGMTPSEYRDRKK